MIALKINGTVHEVDAPPDLPLLWLLRDTLGLKGTKYGCGVGICGICTVLLDGRPARSCVVPVSQAAGRAITTIEGLAQDNHPVLAAWIAEQVPQCGYCQPGHIVTAAALLAEHPRPTKGQVDDALSGVLCRCGTYQRIRRAVERAARTDATGGGTVQTAPAPRQPPAASDKSLAIALGRAVHLDAAGRFAPNPWLRIARDGTVTVIIDRSEMGQGVVTGLALLIAEELEADPASLRIEFAPAAPAYANPKLGEQLTGGSTSIRAAWQPLRQAGAAAREMLISAAARCWDVPREECRADNGFVIHGPSRRRLGFGALADIAATLPVPAEVALKSATAFRLLGRSVPRIEVPDMVAGRAVYGIDVALPGLLYAVVARCPVAGGRTRRFDAGGAGAVAGVRHVVEIDAGIAVVADSFWSACQGREALQVEWDEGANARLTTESIRQQLARAARRHGTVTAARGDTEHALAEAAELIEATYDTPYLAHATLEPMNCTAHVRSDGCDVWVPTQAQQGAWETAARESGLRRDAVRIHTTYLGGGFGRRGLQDFVIEAVQISKAVQAPVQVLWSRDDDLRHDFYRPAHRAVLRAALRRGKPLAWWQRIVGPELALDGIDMPYAIANFHDERVQCDPGIPTGPWRSVGASQNAFVIESFIDELAHAAGRDPLGFRLDLLAASPRHRGVLELAAEKSGWTQPPARGRGRGIAVYRSFGAWVAQVAEVSVARDGGLRVHRVVCAIDCGTVVHPDSVVAQMEGGIVFGLTAALYGEITIEHGRVQQKNFEDYPLLTLRETPKIEVYIVPSNEKPGGVGEPGVPPIAPAVANAVFAATGKRLRSLPLKTSEDAPALVQRARRRGRLSEAQALALADKEVKSTRKG